MNTAFATGDVPLAQGFLDGRAYNNKTPDMAVGNLLARSCPHLTPAEAAACAAPYPDATFKAGARRFPNLVPDHPDAEGAPLSRRAREWFRTEWAGKSRARHGSDAEPTRAGGVHTTRSRAAARVSGWTRGLRGLTLNAGHLLLPADSGRGRAEAHDGGAFNSPCRVCGR